MRVCVCVSIICNVAGRGCCDNKLHVRAFFQCWLLSKSGAIDLARALEAPQTHTHTRALATITSCARGKCHPSICMHNHCAHDEACPRAHRGRARRNSKAQRAFSRVRACARWSHASASMRFRFCSDLVSCVHQQWRIEKPATCARACHLLANVATTTTMAKVSRYSIVDVVNASQL